MSLIASEISDPVYGNFDMRPKPTAKTSPSHTGQSHNSSAAFQTVASIPSAGQCVLCAKGSHKIYQCDMFKGISPERRFKYAAKNHLCFNCLMSSHRTQDCTRDSMCNVQGCKYKHSRLLHFDRAQTTVKSVGNFTSRAHKKSHSMSKIKTFHV